ncbi:MAG: tRNA (cytidine(34)-2'-O)-methyltransferase [Gammaproteobacteria bacterium]|nr:MAG: tRNA (cytidine(34)-2'-O)-methyltransferase [Gammaproteobacteria bacterium]
MLHLVLYQPEIPPNTGNIMRLAANAGAALHLIHPLGFELDEARVRRAGLDYRDLAPVHEYASFDVFRESVQPRRVLAVSTHGRTVYTDVDYADGDALVFGPETRGLPEALLARADTVLRIPMQPDNRSLNLSNACAVVLFEAWRQLGFEGADGT